MSKNFIYQIKSTRQDNLVTVELKPYIQNYIHVWETFSSVKRVKPKYINEISIYKLWMLSPIF